MLTQFIARWRWTPPQPEPEGASSEPWYLSLRQSVDRYELASKIPPRHVKTSFQSVRISPVHDLPTAEERQTHILLAGYYGAFSGFLLGTTLGIWAHHSGTAIAASVGGAIAASSLGAIIGVFVGFWVARKVAYGYLVLVKKYCDHRAHQAAEKIIKDIAGKHLSVIESRVKKLNTKSSKMLFEGSAGRLNLYDRLVKVLLKEIKDIRKEQKNAQNLEEEKAEELARQAVQQVLAQSIATAMSEDISSMRQEILACARCFPEKSATRQSLATFADEIESAHTARQAINKAKAFLAYSDHNERRIEVIEGLRLEGRRKVFSKTNNGARMIKAYTDELNGEHPRFLSEPTEALTLAPAN